MTGSDLLAYLPDKPAKLRVAHTDEKGYYTTPGDTFGSNSAILPSTSQPSNQPPSSPTESSLSSAFGNGTHIPPTPLHPPPRVQIHPASMRDTIYTESSEASSVPRFRTVNSWVRQQTRKRADEVPEQGYGLMLPDEQSPRRVQWNIVRPGGVGFSR
jgi:hypothetical protein